MGNGNNLFCRKVSFNLEVSAGQGMKQIYLYLWCPLFQAQCNQQNYQNSLVTDHHLIYIAEHEIKGEC